MPQPPKRVALLALYASVFAFSLSFGGILPWMALVLEARGTDPTLIGVISAANPVGVLVAAPFVPRLLRRLSAADAMIITGAVTLVSVLLLPVFDSAGAWIVLRFISGAAGAVPWVVTETWINAVANDHSRGRAVAVYSTAMAAGFACGPLVVALIGLGIVMPALVFAAVQAAAVAPVILIRRHSPEIDMSQPVELTAMLWAMPVVLTAGFLAGAGDATFFTFLPIWALRTGLDEAVAVMLLTVFVAGNVLLQLPLGWLADKAGYRRVMAACGLVCAAGPVLAWQVAGSAPLLAAVLFVWGGAMWGLYSVALAALGARFRGALLAAANAAFVMVYTLSNIAGPPLAGLAIKLWDPHGLMALMFAFGVLFMSVIVLRRPRPDER